MNQKLYFSLGKLKQFFFFFINFTIKHAKRLIRKAQLNPSVTTPLNMKSPVILIKFQGTLLIWFNFHLQYTQIVYIRTLIWSNHLIIIVLKITLYVENSH